MFADASNHAASMMSETEQVLPGVVPVTWLARVVLHSSGRREPVKGQAQVDSALYFRHPWQS